MPRAVFSTHMRLIALLYLPMPLITEPVKDDVVWTQALNGKLSYLSAGNLAAGVFIDVLFDSSEGLHYLISLSET